jgi:hypothetical protein
MQQVRYEGSLLASLTELKAIEEQRVAEERTARERAEQDRVEAIATRIRLEKEAAEAKARAEHEKQLALEQARVDAEREARLRVEAAEAAERARQQAELERMRLEQEHELRRAEVAKKRPTWMVAVTVVATLAAGVLVYVAVDSRGAAEDAQRASEIAQRETEQYRADAAKAVAQAEQVERDVAALDGQIGTAIKKLDSLKEQAEILAAKRALDKLNKDRADAANRAAKARIEAERLKRLGGVHDVCSTGAICKPGK